MLAVPGVLGGCLPLSHADCVFFCLCVGVVSGAFIQGLRRVLQQATQVEPAAEVIDNAKAEALNAVS